MSGLFRRFFQRTKRNSPGPKVHPQLPPHPPNQKMNIRSRRLMKEYRNVQRLTVTDTRDPIFTVELIDDNLFEWYVKLYKVDKDSKLYSDMQQLGIDHILLHVIFPENFPFDPPFMRVVAPCIEKGYVMEGGAICMELLTPRGWASAYTIEAVIMQFAASVVKGRGRINHQQQQPLLTTVNQQNHTMCSSSSNGLKKTHHQQQFTLKTAEETFRSLVKTHEKYGWVSPRLADG